MICPQCGTENGAAANFCSQCGAQLASGQGSDDLALRGERRQLTALFCDLVNSTELANTLDPEEYHDTIRDFATCCGAAVASFEGHVAEMRGDGALVFFGYPKSHGDEPERAVRAALRIVEAVGEAGKRRGQPLRVRIGIATGVMAIDQTILDHPAIVGEAVILAARLQEIAEPNTIVIAPLTHELAGAYFQVEELGARELKGFAEPVQAWRVGGTRTIPSRFKARQVAALSPFVGRARESGTILEAWRRAQRGAGSIVAVSGEPGIGKSRLMRHVRDLLSAEVRALEYFCSPYQMATALFPVADRTARLAGFHPADKVAQRVEKLRAAMAAAGPDYEPHFPGFAAIMSLPSEGLVPAVTPEQRKQKMFDALIWWVTAHAQRRPQLMILEDAHWCDPTSAELLAAIADRIAGLPALMIVSVRLPHDAAWISHPGVARIELERLDDHEACQIVAGVSGEAGMGGRDLAPAMIDKILKRTDGIPLFIEEFTKMTLGLAGTTAGVELPATLQDLLAARLDQLAPDKHAAQCAAVIGRTFSYDVLAAVAPLRADVLQASLARLTDAGFIIAHGEPSDRRYLFRHAMVRDAAYESLLKRDRRALHGAVAAALERLSPSEATRDAELLAQHYTEAGLAPEALKYWGVAAQRAMQKAANLEAIQHTERAFELLETLPDTRERHVQELGFRFLAGGAYWGALGFSSPEVEESFTRAQQLSEEVGSDEQSVMAMRGLFGCYYARGELDRAFAQGERVAALAARTGSRPDRMIAQMQKGSISFWRGDFSAARRDLEDALELYDPAEHRAKLSTLQIDPGANSGYHLAWTLWTLGLPDQAVVAGQRALEAARKVGQPLTIAMALFWNAAVKLSVGDLDGAEAATAELRAVTTEFHIRYYRATVTVLEGALLIERDQVEGGMTLLRRSFAEFQIQKAGLGRPWTMAWLAEGCLRTGTTGEGLRTIDIAFAVIESRGEAHWEAELHRLRGDLLVARGELGPAEDAFRTAARIAQRQSALSLELRAAMGLSRILAARGEADKARALLAEIHSRFSEGFGTRDLVRAAHQLGELGGEPAPALAPHPSGAALRTIA
jgi:class 3 adenylate cyclase/tetratricopeptide (TPR) repeat protein